MAEIKQINRAFVGFLLGSAVGGAIALLFAPKSGKQLRSDIKRTSNELFEEGKKISNESWNDAKIKAENLTKSVKAGVNAFNEEIKSEEKVTEEVT